jgi:uncharacterized RDD family membrane protein YckC
VLALLRNPIVQLRIAAALIDLALLTVLSLIIGALLLALGVRAASTFIGIGWIIYFIASELLFARTVGKLVTGLRIVRLDGEPLNQNDVMLRTVTRLVEFLPLFYFLGFVGMLLLGDRQQRLGDFVTGTIVVRASDSP